MTPAFESARREQLTEQVQQRALEHRQAKKIGPRQWAATYRRQPTSPTYRIDDVIPR